MRILATLLALGVCASLSACGSEAEPNDRDREQVQALSGVKRACQGKDPLSVSAVNHNVAHKTSGFVVLCAPLKVIVLDAQGKKPGKDERSDADLLNRYIPQRCGESGARTVSALSNGSSTAATSSFVLGCANGRYLAIGR